MRKIFKSKSDTLFVSKTDRIEKRGKYSLILSPEFYWSKKVTLPVQKIKEALKLAPSIYEGFLPEGEFSYEVRKEGDEFIIIAYDKKKISAELEKIIPYKSDIVDIYFAQDALQQIEECTAVNEKVALTNMDDILIQIPRSCTNTELTLDEMLADATLDKHRVTLSSFDNELLSSSDIKIVASLFGLLFLAFASEYFVYKKAVNVLDDKRASIIQENNLPATSMQLKSIKKSLLKTFNRQKSLRETLQAISKLSLQKGEYIESIEESSKETVVKIHVSSKDRESAIKGMFPEGIMIKESSMHDKTLQLKIAS